VLAKPSIAEIQSTRRDEQPDSQHQKGQPRKRRYPFFATFSQTNGQQHQANASHQKRKIT